MADSRTISRVDVHLCPRYEKAAAILGKRWTGLIIRVLMSGPLRFSEMQRAMNEAVTDRVLTERLRELEQEGIVERKVYPETPVRIEYGLTAKGLGMQKVADAIQEWAEEWIELDETEKF